MSNIEQVKVPGTSDYLTYERDKDGRLLSLSGGGRVYVEQCKSDRIFDSNLAIVSELKAPLSILRRVRTFGPPTPSPSLKERQSARADGTPIPLPDPVPPGLGARGPKGMSSRPSSSEPTGPALALSPTNVWTEEYLWDKSRRISSVDGVTVERDDRGRMVACIDTMSGAVWRYAYAGDRLVVVDGPNVSRHIVHSEDGRPVRVREGGLARDLDYDAEGRRVDAPAPPTSWRFDEVGRLWTIVGVDGRVKTTFLWDGLFCIGRIDGAVGDPLSAVFSLDPSGTPVRVIDRNGVMRIPRDAYGESLLAHPRVPSLFGGAHQDGWVHLPFRRLDPRTAVFDRPDPWHGRADDPRRADGFRGMLTAEVHDGGPYTVCRHDPVGRTDPSGGLSWWLIPSDLTWSYGNNLNTLFTMWLLGNPLFSLPHLSDLGDVDAVSSTAREGSFALRTNGFFSRMSTDNSGGRRAWTYQHTFWLDGQTLTDLKDARLFDPEGSFTLGYYGTMPAVVPSSGSAFTLRSSLAVQNAVSWSRAGGLGQPVIPGSVVPFFPTGGFHFDKNLSGVQCPLAADLKEFAIGGSLIAATMTSATAATLAVAPPPGTVAVRIFDFGAPTLPTLGTSFPTVAIAASVGTVSGPIPAVSITPGSLVVMQQGAMPPIAAAVGKITLNVTFDRTVTAGSGTLMLVPLAPGGFAYQATRVDDLTLTVLPSAVGPSGPASVQMPRFRPQQMVQVSFTGGSDQFRIDSVSGTTITLSGGVGTIPAGAANITVVRLDPQDPGNGGLFAGINGTVTAPIPPAATSTGTFDVWGPTTLAAKALVAITDLTSVAPATITAVNSLTLSLVGTIPNGTYNIFSSSPTAWDAPSVTSTAVNVPNGTMSGGANIAFALTYTDPGAVAHGHLQAGSVMVPIDPDNFELMRRDALVEHELRHTLQSAKWGPLFFGYLPFWALDLGLDLFTDVGMPSYSDYVAGKIDSDGSAMVLNIPAGSVTFAKGDTVQISVPLPSDGASQTQTSGTPTPPVVATLGDLGAKGFAIPADNRLTVGAAVNLRKQTNPSTVAKVFADIAEIGEVLTIGGINNVILGAIFAGIKESFGRLFYALGRKIGGGAKTYPATIQDSGAKFVIMPETAFDAIKGAAQITIQSGDSTYVRGIASVDNTNWIITLDRSVPFADTDQVQVAPYAEHTPGSFFDWNDYFPATIPDATKPADVKIDQVNGESINLSVFDRVIIAQATGQWNYNRVSSVNADGTVTLDQAPSTEGDPGHLRIARVGRGGPGLVGAVGGTLDEFFLNIAGIEWLRWVIDPYGRIEYHKPLDKHDWKSWVTHVLHYMLSTKSWSFLLPIVGGGKFWIDRAFKKSDDYLSEIEQDASENSGDTYCPVGRLQDSVELVGDIGRYWLALNGGTRGQGFPSGSVVNLGLQDKPGQALLHYGDYNRLITHVVTTPAAPGQVPNQGAGVDPTVADPGLDVPDAFYAKPAFNPAAATPANPVAAPAVSPTGFQPAAAGFVPTSPSLERSAGMYVAFSRPGNHRVTIADITDNNAATGDFTQTSNANGLDAQNHGVQTLFFNVNVKDITVSMIGSTVVDGSATAIQLLQTQTAKINIVENSARQYAVTVINPQNGQFLRNASPQDLTIVAQAANTPNPEPVELSRYYQFDASTGKYTSGGVQQHGVHAPADLFVPVRRFLVSVTDQLAIRKAITLQPGDVVPSVTSGGVFFVLLPVSVGAGLQVAFDGNPPSAGQVTISNADISAVTPDVKEYLGNGFGVVELTLGAKSVLTGVSKMTVTVQTSGGATLTGTVDVTP